MGDLNQNKETVNSVIETTTTDHNKTEVPKLVLNMADSKLTLVKLKELYAKYNQFHGIRITVNKLDHANYKQWYQAFGSDMRFYKLWSLCTTECEKTATESDEFKDMNEIGLDQLKNNVNVYYGQMIENDVNLFTAFQKIKSHNEGSPLVRNIRLMRDFADLVHNNKNSDLQEVLVKFKNFKSDLEELHKGLPDGLIIGMLVSIVPKTASDLIKQLMQPKNAEIKFSQAIELFNSDVQLSKEVNQPKEAMKSICAIGKTDDRERFCVYCQIKGHPMSKCTQIEQDKKSGKLTGDVVINRPKSKNRFRSKDKSNDSNSKPPSNSEQSTQPEGASSTNQQSSSNKKKSNKRACALVNSSSDYSLRPDVWHIDSGADFHCARDLVGCVKLVKQYTSPIQAANGSLCHVMGIGTYEFETKSGFTIVLENVQVSTDLKSNYLSYKKLALAGYTIVGKNNYMKVYDDDDLMFEAKFINDSLYECDFIYDKANDLNCEIVHAYGDESDSESPVCNALLNRSKHENDQRYWHNVLNHINNRDLKRMQNDLNIIVSDDFKCLVCKVAKLNRLPFPRKLALSTTKPLQLIHSDLSGIIRLYNPEGYRYYLTFVDDYTRFRMLFLLSRKYQVFDAFKSFKSYMETQTGFKVIALRTDNGTEYCNKPFDEYLNENGIDRQLTIPYSPQMNGVSERDGRTTAEAARCLLIERNLSVMFWPRAVLSAAFVKNRIPHSAINHRIPYEMMFNRKVIYETIRPFGHPVIVLDLHSDNKFSPRGKPGIFTGYPSDTHGYEVYLTEEKQFTLSRDVHFLSENEIDQFNKRYEGQIPVCEDPILLKRMLHVDNENSSDRYLDEPLHNSTTINDDDEEYLDAVEDLDPIQQSNEQSSNQHSSNQHSSNQQSTNQPSNSNQESTTSSNTPLQEFSSIIDSPNGRFVLNKSQRDQIKDKFPNCKFTYIGTHSSWSRANKRSIWELKSSINSICHIFKNDESSSFVPRNFKQATGCKDHILWKAAMDDEHDSLIRNEVYTLVERPKGIRVLPGMWLFKIKLDQYGNPIKYKARYVILGNKQLLVSSNTYSPVVNTLSLRILLSLAVELGLDVHHVDIKTAYLHAALNEVIYVQQPHGYIKAGNENLVCRLSKAIYGLRSSAKQWFTKLTKVLAECGLNPLLSDECIFTNGQINQEMLIVAIYVDDLIIIGSLEKVEKLKNELKKHFSTTDKGRISDCLGLHFNYDLNNGILEIDQKKYANEMLFKFGLKDSKSVRSPIATGVDLNVEVTNPIHDIELYRSMVGSLMYLCNNTRPDIGYSTGLLSRYADKPADIHLQNVKRVLRYVKGTINTKLVYKRGGGSTVVIMSDSDLARDTETSISVSGVCSFVSNNLVGWSSFKQTRVAQFTCEAEVLSVLDGVNELEYVRGFLNELKLTDFVQYPSTLYNDNQGCLTSIDNGGSFRKNKHYRIRLNRIRKAVADGLCVVKYKQTDLMIADALTKPLSFDKSVALWKDAGLIISRE